jgi:hypothetical protein
MLQVEKTSAVVLPGPFASEAGLALDIPISLDASLQGLK